MSKYQGFSIVSSGETWVKVYCANCGEPFCLNQGTFDRLQRSHKTFYCPIGCGQRFESPEEDDPNPV